MPKIILGIDVGGSGIKGAPVDAETGALIQERYRIPTPEGGKPEDVADVVAQIIRFFNWNGPVGIGFPAAIKNGIALTAANIHKKWIDTHIPTLIKQRTGCSSFIVNDADAAGLAEINFGAGKNLFGSVLVITVGTGLGSAFFVNKQLFPNTEFGHIIVNGRVAEHYASDATRKLEDLDWPMWAKRFNEYLASMERLLWPDTFIIGGGVSKKQEKVSEYIKTVKAELLFAQLKNDAGIIGAALAAGMYLV